VVKCSEVLQCIVGLRNKVSSVIRRHTDNMGLLLVYNLLLSHSFIFNVYMVVFLFNNIIYVSLLLCLIVCLCIHFMFMYLHHASWHSSATLTEVFPCFFLSCEANARVKPAKMGHGQHSS
jgi:hypothetical protein